MKAPLRAAVIGVGYLGRFHAEKFAALPNVELVAVVDCDRQRAEDVARRLGTRALTDYRRIVGQVDLVSIAVPTELHFAVACDFLAAGCHVLLEKPMTPTLAEADALIALAAANGVVLQVGYLERFNPAVMALYGAVDHPRVIFSHRLTPYRLRGTDVSVVLDLMIHDIDIVLHNVASPLDKVQAVGSVGPSGRIDIANARLQFANGCVANLTASRVSDAPQRRLRIYGADGVASVDCQGRRIDVLGAGPGGGKARTFGEGDPLREEVAAFVAAVRSGRAPRVSGEDGRRALAVALRIEEALEPLTADRE